jgi:hypothetical protein
LDIRRACSLPGPQHHKFIFLVVPTKKYGFNWWMENKNHYKRWGCIWSWIAVQNTKFMAWETKPGGCTPYPCGSMLTNQHTPGPA